MPRANIFIALPHLGSFSALSPFERRHRLRLHQTKINFSLESDRGQGLGAKCSANKRNKGGKGGSGDRRGSGPGSDDSRTAKSSRNGASLNDRDRSIEGGGNGQNVDLMSSRRFPKAAQPQRGGGGKPKSKSGEGVQATGGQRGSGRGRPKPKGASGAAQPIVTTFGEDDEEVLVTLTDDLGRSLICSVEHEVEINGEELVVLLPRDEPVQIFTWGDEADGAGEGDQLVLIDDEAVIEELFPIAEAVLKEEEVALKRSGFVLTIQDANDPTGAAASEDDDDDDLSAVEFLDSLEAEMAGGATDEGDGADGEAEDVQLLASFVGPDGREYNVCAPMEPLFLVARRKIRSDDLGLDYLDGDYDAANLEVLTADELSKIDSTLSRVIEDGIFAVD